MILPTASAHHQSGVEPVEHLLGLGVYHRGGPDHGHDVAARPVTVLPTELAQLRAKPDRICDWDLFVAYAAHQ
jgi:hypothetical protein